MHDNLSKWAFSRDNGKNPYPTILNTKEYICTELLRLTLIGYLAIPLFRDIYVIGS